MTETTDRLEQTIDILIEKLGITGYALGNAIKKAFMTWMEKYPRYGVGLNEVMMRNLLSSFEFVEMVFAYMNFLEPEEVREFLDEKVDEHEREEEEYLRHLYGYE